MRLKGSLTINGRQYTKGDQVPWTLVYPFFLLHMLIFGGSGFAMAYATQGSPALFLFMHGGFAIVVYTVFYLTMFGREDVKWMFINGALGVIGIYSQIGWVLALFGKEISDYPLYIHIIPFLYYVLYTFLVRQALLDITGARDDKAKQTRVEQGYIAGSLLLYATGWILQ